MNNQEIESLSEKELHFPKKILKVLSIDFATTKCVKIQENCYIYSISCPEMELVCDSNGGDVYIELFDKNINYGIDQYYGVPTLEEFCRIYKLKSFL